MSKIKIGIFGTTGKMGLSLIQQSSKFNQLSLVSVCEKKGHSKIGTFIDELEIIDDIKLFISLCDVIIDFTCPHATLNLMKQIRTKKNVALVTGTTGYNKDEEKSFKKLAKGLTVLRSSNMSLGVNLLFKIGKLLASKVGKEVDIEIAEKHHRSKLDAPSGTAISLGNSIKEGRKKYEKNNFIFREKNLNSKRQKGDIGFSSIRGGDVVGEHSVYFMMDNERIELSHKASSRDIFSNGALKAAIWIKGKKPGLYNINDMIS